MAFRPFQLALIALISFNIGVARAADLPPQSMTLRTGTASGGVQDFGLLGDSRSINLYTNRKSNLNVEFRFGKVLSGDKVAFGLRPYRSGDSFYLGYRRSDGGETPRSCEAKGL